MKVSHVHFQLTDLREGVRWFGEHCDVAPSFSDARMAVLVIGEFTLILDAAATDSVATIGFNSADCDTDFAEMVERGAVVLEPPQDRPYGARVAYIKGPGYSGSSSSNCCRRSLDKRRVSQKSIGGGRWRCSQRPHGGLR